MGVAYSKAQNERDTVSKRVLEELRLHIILNQYPKGTRLLELELSKKYSASRGTIRSTLMELANEGLVEFTETGGCIAVGLDEKTLMDIYDFRCRLELQAAEILLTDRPFSVLGMMQVLDEFLQKDQNPLYQTNPLEFYIDLDMRFHQALVYAAQNRPVYRAWCALSEIIRMLMRFNLSDDYRISFQERFYTNHKAIMDHALLKDSALLDEIRNHFNTAVEVSKKQLSMLQQSPDMTTTVGLIQTDK